MPVVPIRRALLSVTDKRRLTKLAAVLREKNVQIISTGGTANALREAGFEVLEVANMTGYPEIFGGRVKTLHPKVHGGLLMRRDNPDDRDDAGAHSIPPIDLVVSNLYEFERASEDPARTEADTIEAIDVGGPAMIRAAAKNHAHVAVVTDTGQYDAVAAEIREHGGLTDETRRRLAAEAFALTADYDRRIADWFTREKLPAGADTASVEAAGRFPERMTVALRLRQSLRYGENPHQRAAFYQLEGEEGRGVAACTQLHGKQLSFNNLIDADIALALPFEFERPAVAILKHTTPSGIGIADTLSEAEAKARACDPVSAFGGIIGMNRRCDRETAEQIANAFTEVVIAPGFDDDALARLKKKKNLRLLVAPEAAAEPFGFDFRRVGGGMLVQDRDAGFPELAEWRIVTERKPEHGELEDLRFAWIACKYVKSNAVCFAREGATLGMGAGQMSRVDSVRLAHWKAEQAELELTGSALASDAFFPFPDGLLAAADAGARAVVQPGGSVRDQEVIDAANERGVAMILTGRRHFRHA